MTLLRAMDPKYSTDADVLRTFYETTVEKIVDGRSAGKLDGKIAVDDIVYPAKSEKAGEIIPEVVRFKKVHDLPTYTEWSVNEKVAMEAALAFARADITVETSLRFIFWNAEETGLDGSSAYVSHRAELQGREDPPRIRNLSRTDVDGDDLARHDPLRPRHPAATSAEPGSRCRC